VAEIREEVQMTIQAVEEAQMETRVEILGADQVDQEEGTL
jgi:hypothetical protein